MFCALAQLRLLLWRLSGAAFGWAGIGLGPVVVTPFSRPHELLSRGGGLKPKLRDLIMDNVTSLPHSTDPCVIKLNQYQYAFFQQSLIEIHSPDGECLARFGEESTRNAEEDASYQLWEQACLLEVLLDQVQEDVLLPPRAATCLADLMGRINAHFLKTQMT